MAEDLKRIICSGATGGDISSPGTGGGCQSSECQSRGVVEDHVSSKFEPDQIPGIAPDAMLDSGGSGQLQFFGTESDVGSNRYGFVDTHRKSII